MKPRPQGKERGPAYLPFGFWSDGLSGGRSMFCLVTLALCASLLPDEFFFGFLSPIWLDSLFADSLALLLVSELVDFVIRID